MLPTSNIDAVLFNAGEFDYKLNQSDQSLPVFKQALKQASATLIEYFQAGRSASELVLAWARFIDNIVIQAWSNHIDSDIENLSLLAVGGYGRGELHPHSDIDLMILLKETTHAYDEQLENFYDFYGTSAWR